MTTEEKALPEHHGQHKHDCGKCNGWRYDRMVERKEAAARGETLAEDADRVVPADDEWNWHRRATQDKEITDEDAKWTNRILERCFKGSQAGFTAGVGTPGQIGVSNFIVGLLLAQQRPDMQRRILRGIERGAAAATGRPAEQFERELREMVDELIQSLENET